MTPLDEAWAWYRATRDAARWLDHLGKYWGLVPWDDESGWVRGVRTDNALGQLQPGDFGACAADIRRWIDDMGVFVLFAAFEAMVRDFVGEQVRPEVGRLRHPAVKGAGSELVRDIESGPFSRLLNLYKLPTDNDLVEQVKQVRQYRNWVSHGRRPPKPGQKRVEVVRPKAAYERLKAFLELVGLPPPGPTT